jgi:hypothetical protein
LGLYVNIIIFINNQKCSRKISNFKFSIDLTLGSEFRYFVHQNGPVPISDDAGAKDYQNFSRIVSDK